MIRSKRGILALAAVAMMLVSTGVFAVCGFSWEQFIENDDNGSGTRVGPSYYYTNWSGVCDDDPSDMEYVFVYRLNYSCDPDGLRYDNGGYWHSANLRVLSPVSSDDDVHVCIGSGTLRWWYGNDVNNVWNNLKVYYN